MASLIDFNVLNTRVLKYQEDFGLDRPSDAFSYVALETILGLPINEIENCIVDGPQDRGIDAIFIDDEDADSEDSDVAIHIFQFKYTTNPNKINNNFPGIEVDKIITTIEDTLQQDDKLQKEVNPELWRKIQDIKEIFERKGLPRIIVYFCGNMQSLATHEKERAERSLGKYKNLTVEHYSLERFVEGITTKHRKKIDGKIHFIDKQYFENSTGAVRAVIGSVSALDLIELIKDKNNPDKIQEAIFEDNIRVYQGSKKNPINQAILKTALDDNSSHEFFYLNNGITMTCDGIEYTPIRHPLVELKNVQIVNGSQTSHALFEAYQSLEDKNKLDQVLILLRIYQTQKDIVSRIVETTNSQTLINSRDLKANDQIQRKLHSELLDKGYFYEGKRDYYELQSREKRLDAQVVGQVLMAYYLSRPDEVKFRRREIFGKFYDEVFHKDLNADNILTTMAIFREIETKKITFQKSVRANSYDPRLLFLPHASFYILYGIRVAVDKYNRTLTLSNTADGMSFYDAIVGKLADIVEESEKNKGKKYSHNSFFRDKKSVVRLEEEILTKV